MFSLSSSLSRDPPILYIQRQLVCASLSASQADTARFKAKFTRKVATGVLWLLTALLLPCTTFVCQSSNMLSDVSCFTISCSCFWSHIEKHKAAINLVCGNVLSCCLHECEPQRTINCFGQLKEA